MLKKNKNSIKMIFNDLYIIKLYPPISGFKNFIGVWLYKTKFMNILIDVGPSISKNQLHYALLFLGITKIHYIFLTHIHIDHSGSIDSMSKFYKKPTIVCHNKAIPYIQKPNRLWQKSMKVLKQISQSYTSPQKINTLNNILLSYKSKLTIKKIQIINTIGHSPHHISIIIDKYLFIGESIGVNLNLSFKKPYKRLATPIKFSKKKYLKSLSKILNIKSKKIFYGHILNNKQNNLKKNIKEHINQLKLWELTLNNIQKEYNIHPSKKSTFIKICFNEIIKKDPLLKDFKKMNKRTQKREEFFIKNSIEGLEDL